jgi:hypothetical protein
MLGRSRNIERLFCATMVRRCRDTRSETVDPYRDVSLLALRSVSARHGLCEACEMSGACRQMVGLNALKRSSSPVERACPGAQFLGIAE